MATAQTIVTNALRRAKVIDLYAAIPTDDLNKGLAYLGEMIDGWHAEGIAVYGAFIATTATGSDELTDVDPRQVAMMFVGMIITGTGIQGGTLVSEIIDATTIQISKTATATNADITLGFSDLPIAAKMTRWVTAMLAEFVAGEYDTTLNKQTEEDARMGKYYLYAEYRRRPAASLDAALISTSTGLARSGASFEG